VKISRCIAAALLVGSVGSTSVGCSSCAKDDAPANRASSDSPPTAMTDRKASPMPRFFERKAPPSQIENLAPGMLDGGQVGQPAPAAPVAGDAGSDAATPTPRQTH